MGNRLSKIYTRTGDDGSTGLGDGTRVSKDSARVTAYGTVDEASSAIGLAKALTSHARVRAICEELQRGLYALGAELSTSPKAKTRFAITTEAHVARLEELMAELERDAPMPAAFILPGLTPASGALDLARAVTRRAERRCLTLQRSGGIRNPQVARWLNRLSLVLFVLGRYEESKSGKKAHGAKIKRGS